MRDLAEFAWSSCRSRNSPYFLLDGPVVWGRTRLSGTGGRGEADTLSWSEYMAHNECSVLPEGHCQIHGGGLSCVRPLVPDTGQGGPAGCDPEILRSTNKLLEQPIHALSTCVPALPEAAGGFLRVACKKL